MSQAVLEKLSRAFRHAPPDDRNLRGALSLPGAQDPRKAGRPASELSAKELDGTLLSSPEVRLDTVFAREMSVRTYGDALRIGLGKWGDEPDCVDDMKTVWRSYVKGLRTFFSEYLGDNVTLVFSAVYYDQLTNERMAIGGLYRLEKEPQTVWFDWFALDPEYARSHAGALPKGVPTPTAQVMEHLCAVGRASGATWIKAWTPDDREYMLAQAFYERHGMKILGLFDHAGQTERVYGKQLSDG